MEGISLLHSSRFVSHRSIVRGLLKSFVLVLLLAASGSSMADGVIDEGRDYTGGYFGAGPLLWMYADESVEGGATGVGVNFRAGYRFHRAFSIEARVSAGGSGTLEGINVELIRAVQLLAVYSDYVTERLRMGGYVGVSDTELEFSSFGFSAADSDVGFSFGSILEYETSPNWSIYGDFGLMQWSSRHGIGYIVAGASVGALYRF